MTDDTPRVFIGSSTESIDVAHVVQQLLQSDGDIRATVWKHGLFEANKTTLESLTDELGAFDFGMFVFSADDVTHMRDEKRRTVRDNVLLEFGMFVGRLGRERCFIVRADEADVASDLAGVTTLTFKMDA